MASAVSGISQSRGGFAPKNFKCKAQSHKSVKSVTIFRQKDPFRSFLSNAQRWKPAAISIPAGQPSPCHDLLDRGHRPAESSGCAEAPASVQPRGQVLISRFSDTGASRRCKHTCYETLQKTSHFQTCSSLPETLPRVMLLQPYRFALGPAKTWWL